MLEIRNLKEMKGHDGWEIAFTANLYRDGKPDGTVGNSGTGGPNYYNGVSVEATNELEQMGRERHPDAKFELDDIGFGVIHERYLLVKDYKRRSLKNTVYIETGVDDPWTGYFRQINKFTVDQPQTKAALKKWYPEGNYEVFNRTTGQFEVVK